MEIIIDADFVRPILTREYQLAREEIRDTGPLRALERSQGRHDARIAAAPDVTRLDCRAGCSWCCHFSVDVRAVEIFGIVDFLERSFTSERMALVLAQARANAAVLDGLDEIGRMTRNVKCPFLDDGRCAIYSARPQTCRNYHATDVAGCKRSYEHPEDLDLDPEFAPGVYQAGVAHVEAFSTAMRDEGYDVDAYELNRALDAALSDPASRARFEARLAPFAGLAGEEVPPEFDDLDD